MVREQLSKAAITQVITESNLFQRQSIALNATISG